MIHPWTSEKARKTVAGSVWGTKFGISRTVFTASASNSQSRFATQERTRDPSSGG